MITIDREAYVSSRDSGRLTIRFVDSDGRSWHTTATIDRWEEIADDDPLVRQLLLIEAIRTPPPVKDAP